MAKKKILFFSGSLGLGHVTRDLAIANQLKKQNPEVEISWLAANPANQLIKNAGENLLPEADQLANDNITAEKAAIGQRLNLIKLLLKAKNSWIQNVNVLKRITSKNKYDLVIGDETYEISVAFKKEPELKTFPFVMIYDFVGLDVMTSSPMERLGVYVWNRIWAKDYNRTTTHINRGLFIGEEEDIPNRRFGLLLPNRREYAKRKDTFVGYVFPFDPEQYADKAKVKKKLGYGNEKLVICAIGGTAIGKELIELCGHAYPIIKKEIPDLRMVLVCGPRLSTDSLKVPPELELKGYIPNLYQHFAASDLAIIQAGGTTTLELTALRRPFIYFPIEGHCEQQICVAGRLARHKAGVKMIYSQTTLEALSEKVISNIGKEVTYPPIPTDGAKKAAQLINELL